MKKLDIFIYFYIILNSMLLIVSRSGSVPRFIIHLSLSMNFTVILIRLYLEKKYSSGFKKTKKNHPKWYSLKNNIKKNKNISKEL